VDHQLSIYGSSVNGLAAKETSDLDLSLLLPSENGPTDSDTVK